MTAEFWGFFKADIVMLSTMKLKSEYAVLYYMRSYE